MIPVLITQLLNCYLNVTEHLPFVPLNMHWTKYDAIGIVYHNRCLCMCRVVLQWQLLVHCLFLPVFR